MSPVRSPDSPRKGTNLSYMPALDGIRGVGMLGIMGVHAGVWLTGGGFFLLDSFFALSGFLITSLLVVEWRKRGTIRLRQFWARRARRLLPALFLMLLGASFIFGVLVPRGTYPGFRGDALASLFYVANWHFIFNSSNYFVQTGLTSPLIHMWSLAVEEQFYLVWPLVFLAVMRFWRSLWALLAVCVIGALASAIEMALLYKPGNTTRLYFGTDTHAQSVLVGAALAVGLAIWSERRSRAGDPEAGANGELPSTTDWHVESRRGRRLLTVIGVVGVVVSGLMYATLNSTDSFSYRGGFLIASLAASAVLLSVSCVPLGPVSRTFSFAVFTYIGRISYGMYLWHFPLFTYINHARTGLTGWALFGVRFVITLAIATASFYLVERPIRMRTFITSRRAWVATPLAVGTVAVAVAAAGIAPAAANEVATPSGSVPATPIHGAIGITYQRAPVRVLLVGDSEALTLGLGVSVALQSDPGRYRIDLLDEGIVACGVADGSTFTKMGQAGQQVGWPCTADPAMGNCPPGGIFGPRRYVPCQAWTSAWADWVRQFSPNVVVLLAGGAEVLDRVYEGRTTDILNPSFASYVRSQLQRAVQIATADGALMVFMTKPCQDTGEQPNGEPWPEDSAARQKVYNSLLREVAAQDAGRVYVQDLNSYVCPGGHFSSVLHGVPVRSPDGVHFTNSGGEYVTPALVPYWEELGHLQEESTHGASVATNRLPAFFAPW
ncbi:MAG TPA: acyltransferase family protein [Acidimicrobiales bacterium]|nr:acyltransferase family protein [Acidimicrobiales bacterium]